MLPSVCVCVCQRKWVRERESEREDFVANLCGLRLLVISIGSYAIRVDAGGARAIHTDPVPVSLPSTNTHINLVKGSLRRTDRAPGAESFRNTHCGVYKW